MIDPERKEERNKDARDVKRGSELPPLSLQVPSSHFLPISVVSSEGDEGRGR